MSNNEQAIRAVVKLRPIDEVMLAQYNVETLHVRLYKGYEPYAALVFGEDDKFPKTEIPMWECELRLI